MIAAMILGLFIMLFPNSTAAARLETWLKRECWHNWVKVGPTGKLTHCTICQIELHEDNWHPLIKYKCSKCGEESEVADNMQLLNEDGTQKVDQ
jgi:hypothetical protein